MKRANQLQPLSREHHLGLVLCRQAKECSNDVKEIAEHWTALTDYMKNNMINHFDVEDNLLVSKLENYKQTNPNVADVIDKIESQHKKLYELVDLPSISASQVRELGTVLYDHIRFEEREMFPLVQELFSEQELTAIYDASSENVKRHNEDR